MFITKLEAQSNPYSNIRIFDLAQPIQPIVNTEKTIIPSSIQFSINDVITKVSFEWDNNKITIDTSSFSLLEGDSLHLFLRVFPHNYEKEYFTIDANKVFSEDIAIPIEADFRFLDEDRRSLFKKGIKYDGSFSRGISVGNSQSLVLDAQLNLRLKGDLGDGLAIEAVISDDQIPIQPEGNTQILQEFDKVYIKISKDESSLVAGDYDLKSMPFQFARYQKKMKGIKAEHLIKNLGGASVLTKASFAISKGTFVREKLANKEGNQGPYKLKANSSSNYLIIIAGSEKVFMDGVLLKRGEALDYTIDYNRAEIFFTAKNIIDADKRIFIEYEYRDQSYLRSMYAIQNQVKKGKAIFSVDFFRESDSKSIVNNDEIDSLDLLILENAGNDITKSVRSGIFPIDNLKDDNREYYNKMFVDSTIDSVLVYTDEPSVHSYVASFSNLGPGNGSYIIDPDANANGRVYKYVGVGQGEYAPIRQLIPPKKKQMLSFGAKIELPKNTIVSTEISLSDFDHNRFSTIGNTNNKGVAGLFSIHKTTPLDSNRFWVLQTGFTSEYIHENFNSINPYRNVEYSRDWNLSNTSLRSDEYLNKIDLKLSHSQDLSISYAVKSFIRNKLYKGLKHTTAVSITKKRFGLKLDGSYLTSEDKLTQTKFWRPNSDIYYNISSHWKIGTRFNLEHLDARDIVTELLHPTSNAYDKYTVYLMKEGDENFVFQMVSSRRVDRKVKNGNLEDAYQSDDFKLNGQWSSHKHARLNYDIGIRNLKVLDPSITTHKSAKHILSNTSYQFSAYKKAIKSNTRYQIGIGQEPKLEFTFEKVQAGEGNYGWLDYNGDGKEQIDEFVISNLLDTANYIKIPIFNNEYVSTNTIEFTQNLRLDPSIYIGASEKLKWLKRWSSNSTFRYRQKQILKEDNKLVPFFRFDLEDTLIFAHNGSIQNTIFYNKGNPSYDFQVGQSLVNNKLAQVTGYEIFESEKYFLRNRVNLWSSTDLINKYTFGKRNRISEKFATRAYQILSHLITSTVSYRPRPSLRFNMTAEYDQRENIITDQETLAKSKKFNLNINYKLGKKSSLITDFKFVNVDYNGEKNTPLYTVMLDGLNKGNNFIWSVWYSRELRDNLYLTMRYNGRKVGDINTIHTASAQVKASF